MDNDNKLCDKCGLRPQQKAQPKPCACKPKKCCKKKDCCNDNEFAFRKVVIPASLGDDVTGQDKPENGAYTNSYVEYEANGAQYMYDSYGVYTKIEGGGGGGGTSDFNKLGNRPKYAGEVMTSSTDIPSVSAEATAREQADNGLQSQIDAITVSSDVKDIVGTYAALEAYDTSTLGNNDIIKVLQDETHDDETTYYRWSTITDTFTLIGEEGPYYTKSAADLKFQDKLTAGANITIASDNTISADDSETIFYADLNETGTTRHIYKDINFTSAASAQDLISANDEGQVILRCTSTANPTAYNDSYLQNAFIMPHNNDYEFVFLDRDLRYEYTASATTDTAFYYDTSEIQPKLTAGTNVTISGTTISATDTTYSDFVGTDGTAVGTAGLVPAPATTDAGKFLKADGTWDTAGGGGPTVVQTTGTSQTDVMSQKAVTNMIFPEGNESDHLNILVGSLSSTPAVLGNYNIRIGSSINTASNSQEQVIIGHAAGNSQSANECVILGHSAYGQSESVAIGHSAKAQGGGNTIAVGHSAQAFTSNTIAIGSNIRVANAGSVVIGNGYANNTQYTTRTNEFCVHASNTANQPMVHSNVDTPTLGTDAANKDYVDSSMANAALIGSTLSTPTNVAYVATANIQDGAVTADKIDWTTSKPVYAQQTWPRTNISSEQGAAAINGTYTADTTLATITLTPVKSGLMSIEANIPCNTDSGGTPFIRVFIDSSTSASVTGTVPPVGDQQGQSPIVMKKIVQVTPNVQHTFTLKFMNGNAISSRIPGLLPAYFSVTEIG